MKKFMSASLALVLTAGAASAQYLMMPDSTNNRLVLFDPFDGSVVNSNYFALQGGTPIHAMQVGNEIWVSEQVGDRVSRWDVVSGAHLGNISGGLDNLRGMELKDGKVYVCNDGTGNGAPGHSLRIFDTAGNSLGHFTTPFSSPFGVLDYGPNLLVASDAANDDVHQYTTAGASVGTFHNSASLNFAEQMNYDAAGNILVAGFSSNNVVTLDYNTGALLSSFAASGTRGVWQLGNGNIMWTNGSGANIWDGTSSTLIYAGGGRYIDFVLIPTPGGLALLGVAGLLGARRRR